MPDGRKKVKGIIHWVSAVHAVRSKCVSMTACFGCRSGGRKGRDYRELLNPESLEVLAMHWWSLASRMPPGDAFQFERLGYFCVDSKDSLPGRLVFNRSVTLRDTWAKMVDN